VSLLSSEAAMQQLQQLRQHLKQQHQQQQQPQHQYQQQQQQQNSQQEQEQELQQLKPSFLSPWDGSALQMHKSGPFRPAALQPLGSTWQDAKPGTFGSAAPQSTWKGVEMLAGLATPAQASLQAPPLPQMTVAEEDTLVGLEQERVPSEGSSSSYGNESQLEPEMLVADWSKEELAALIGDLAHGGSAAAWAGQVLSF